MRKRREDKIKEAARKVGATLVSLLLEQIAVSRQTYYNNIYKQEAYFLHKKLEKEKTQES